MMHKHVLLLLQFVSQKLRDEQGNQLRCVNFFFAERCFDCLIVKRIYLPSPMGTQSFYRQQASPDRTRELIWDHQL
jgi:hypothetical protein